VTRYTMGATRFLQSEGSTWRPGSMLQKPAKVCNMLESKRFHAENISEITVNTFRLLRKWVILERLRAGTRMG